MLTSRLIYLELTTIGKTKETLGVQARQYDISDDTLVAKMLAAIHDHDWRRIEYLREPLGAGAADMLAAAYWTLPGWIEKALLAQVAREVRDHSHAGLRAVFDDLLDIPDTGPSFNPWMAPGSSSRCWPTGRPQSRCGPNSRSCWPRTRA